MRLRSVLVSRGLLYGQSYFKLNDAGEIHTANPCEHKAEDLATDDGEMSRKQTCQIAANRDRVTRKVCDECCECLSLISSVTACPSGFEKTYLNTSSKKDKRSRPRAPIMIQHTRVKIPQIPVRLSKLLISRSSNDHAQHHNEWFTNHQSNWHGKRIAWLLHVACQIRDVDEWRDNV